MLWPTGPVTTELSHRAPDQFLNPDSGAKDANGGDFSPGGHRVARSYTRPQRPPASLVLSNDCDSRLPAAARCVGEPGRVLVLGGYCRGRCSSGRKQRPESCRRVRSHPLRDVAVKIEGGLNVIVAEALAQRHDVDARLDQERGMGRCGLSSCLSALSAGFGYRPRIWSRSAACSRTIPSLGLMWLDAHAVIANGVWDGCCDKLRATPQGIRREAAGYALRTFHRQPTPVVGSSLLQHRPLT